MPRLGKVVAAGELFVIEQKELSPDRYQYWVCSADRRFIAHVCDWPHAHTLWQQLNRCPIIEIGGEEVN